MKTLSLTARMAPAAAFFIMLGLVMSREARKASSGKDKDLPDPLTERP
jgi:hypothetical protein